MELALAAHRQGASGTRYWLAAVSVDPSASAHVARRLPDGRSAHFTYTCERTHIMLINLLVWIIVGGIAGWLASLLVQGTGMGIVGDVIVGIVGALIGAFVLSLLLPGTFGISGFNLGSLVVAFIGAVILLFIVKLFTGRRAVS